MLISGLLAAFHEVSADALPGLSGCDRCNPFTIKPTLPGFTSRHEDTHTAQSDNIHALHIAGESDGLRQAYGLAAIDLKNGSLSMSVASIVYGNGIYRNLARLWWSSEYDATLGTAFGSANVGWGCSPIGAIAANANGSGQCRPISILHGRRRVCRRKWRWGRRLSD